MLLDDNIPYAYLWKKIRFELLYVVVICTLVFFINKEFGQYLPDMPIAIPTFIGTALSVILSFKMAQSYDRWWEARKIWGAIVNDSRTLVLQVKAFLDDDTDIRRIAHRQVAWVHTLARTLRRQELPDKLSQLLSDKELERVRSKKNAPLEILSCANDDLRQLRTADQIDIFQHLQLNETMARLVDHQGRCERIKNTVFPVTYRIFLQVLIYVFIGTLSVAMRSVPFEFELPLLLVVGAAFFLLSKSAGHLQDPFDNFPTDTPVTTIATTIEINVRELLDEDEIPAPHPSNKYYQM